MVNKRLHPTDLHVGSRVRLRRKLVGMSQKKLGVALGITFQQVQKYEKGTNRVSAGRLQRIAELLNVPITYFYAGMGSKKQAAQSTSLALVQTKGAIRLLRAYGDIPSRATKYALVVLADSLRGKGRG
jgi:transcriptional regulator with XRE-family HTH domain